MTDARGVSQHAEHLDGDLDVGAVGVASTHWVGLVISLQSYRGSQLAAVNSPNHRSCRPLTLTTPRSLAQVQSDFGGVAEGTVDVPGLSGAVSVEYGVLRCTGSGVVCAFFACLALAARLRVSTMMAKAIGP